MRIVLFTLLASFLVIGTARATPSFPDVIAGELRIGAPDCSLCHTGNPARGNVQTPFGTTVRSRGLRAYDEQSLRVAIAAITAEKKDSDEDGAADVDELSAGTDPNAAEGESVIPEYGCGQGRTHDGAWWAIAFFAACVAVRHGRRARIARNAAVPLTTDSR